MKVARPYTMRARADAVEATRDRIVDAAMALFFEHAYEDVTLAGIAKAAGVSHQTVLNHFESKEGVALAVADRVRRARPTTPATGPSPATSQARSARWSASTSGWATPTCAGRRRAERLGSLAAILDTARASHQEWLRHMFGARLPRDVAARRRAVNALHAATDVFTWKLLRRDLRCTRAETERTIVHLVEAILDTTDQGATGMTTHPRATATSTSSPSSTAAEPCRPSSPRRAASSSGATPSPSWPRTPWSTRSGRRAPRSAGGSRHPTALTAGRRTTPTATGSAPTRSSCSAGSSTRSSSGRADRYKVDVDAAIDAARPDLVVCSQFAFGAMVAAEAAGIPFDVLMPNIYLLPRQGDDADGRRPAPGEGPLGGCGTGPC